MMKRILPPLFASVLLGACSSLTEPDEVELSTFKVTVLGVYSVPSGGAAGTRTPVDVTTPCQSRLRNGGLPNGESLGESEPVPLELRGTPDCPYVIPRGNVEMDVSIVAIDRTGKPLESFEGPVSYRVIPGALTGDYSQRWTQLSKGVGAGTVRVAHLYSEVRVWVEDAPVTLNIVDGGVAGDTTKLPTEPEHRTFATGLSQPLYFDEPTIAAVQTPDRFDNRESPFEGQFMTVGRAPENGEPIRQSCARAPDGGVFAEDGQPAKLVVTGMDPGGFFVTDATACPLAEVLQDPATGRKVSVPEPSGFYPGRFASLYIYNYSYPEGLDQGDVLWAISGGVQEFSGTTQLVFPAWLLRERAREKPESEWLRHLADIPVVDLNLRHCWLFDELDPFVTDVLCGQNARNLKLESLESGLVRVRRARVPELFVNCDRDGDGQVPFFCEGPASNEDGAPWIWKNCGDDPWEPAAPENAELVCTINCVTGQGEFAGRRCAERATFTQFGQFVVEMNGPGPAEAGLDDSLAGRMLQVPVSAASSATSAPLPVASEVRVWCDIDARMKVGAEGVVATAEDAPIAARTLVELQLGEGETHLAFIQAGAASGTCTVAPNPRTRINVVTKDALPQLEPDCSTDAASVGEEKARECQNFRGASYDIVGHLRQVQAARPRWVVLPRDADDVCCHPGPGLECPKSVKPCP